VHLAFVGTSSGTSLYVNGAFSQTITASGTLPLTTISNGGILGMAGALDEVRAYSRALSPIDIQGLATVTNVPTILSIAPNFGVVAGGQTVTITGTHLTGATAVTFGGAA